MRASARNDSAWVLRLSACRRGVVVGASSAILHLALSPLILVGLWSDLGALDEAPLPGFSIAGILTIEIEPAEAVTNTRWQIALGVDDDGVPIVDEGAWRFSGETQEGLPAGTHTLVFRTAREWADPGPRSLHVVGGEVSHTEELLPRVIYESIHDVPPLAAKTGETVSFLIDPSSYIVDYEPDPQASGGLREIAIVDGLFTYRPSPDERQQFLLTLGNDMGEQANVVVTPRNALVAEQKILQYRTETAPDPEAKAYLFITEEIEPRMYFNHDEQDVSDVIISGHTVVFERDHPNELFDSYAYDPPHEVDHIRSVTIYADSVIIREPLHLPQTNVEIFARELRFEDTGDAPASLKTTPLGATKGTTRNGADGLTAGDVTLNVAALFAPPSQEPRFHLDGGRGQDPAEGSPGADGASQTDYASYEYYDPFCGGFRVHFPEDTVYIHVNEWLCGVDGGAKDTIRGLPWKTGRHGTAGLQRPRAFLETVGMPVSFEPPSI